jgi:hypothetical protein
MVKGLTMEETISKLLNYRGYAGDVELIALDAPEEVCPVLDDLFDALAGAGAGVEQGGNELAALKNSLICMHNVLKVYEEHNFDVPQRLTVIHERLEQRRSELEPEGPHL